MASTEIGIEKLPLTGSTFWAESTNNIPSLSGVPFMLSVPFCVCTTLGTIGRAEATVGCRSGRSTICWLVTVAEVFALSVAIELAVSRTTAV
jgi:hypothetical protein